MKKNYIVYLYFLAFCTEENTENKKEKKGENTEKNSISLFDGLRITRPPLSFTPHSFSLFTQNKL